MRLRVDPRTGAVRADRAAAGVAAHARWPGRRTSATGSSRRWPTIAAAAAARAGRDRPALRRAAADRLGPGAAAHGRGCEGDRLVAGGPVEGLERAACCAGCRRQALDAADRARPREFAAKAGVDGRRVGDRRSACRAGAAARPAAAIRYSWRLILAPGLRAARDRRARGRAPRPHEPRPRFPRAGRRPARRGSEAGARLAARAMAPRFTGSGATA